MALGRCSLLRNEVRRATSLCLGPGDGHVEHELGSHQTKPGAALGAGLEARRPPPGEAGAGEPHLIQLLRTVFSNKDENQAVPLLCDSRDLVQGTNSDLGPARIPPPPLPLAVC